MQSRIGSIIEAAANILIGYLVAMAAQTAIFPLFGFYASPGEHAQIAALFTVISLARSYCLRRLFNRITRERIKGRTDGSE